MSRYFQQNLFKNDTYTKEFGGSHLVDRRKVARPLSTKLRWVYSSTDGQIVTTGELKTGAKYALRLV